MQKFVGACIGILFAYLGYTHVDEFVDLLTRYNLFTPRMEEADFRYYLRYFYTAGGYLAGFWMWTNCDEMITPIRKGFGLVTAMLAGFIAFAFTNNFIDLMYYLKLTPHSGDVAFRYALTGMFTVSATALIYYFVTGSEEE